MPGGPGRLIRGTQGAATTGKHGCLVHPAASRVDGVSLVPLDGQPNGGFHPPELYGGGGYINFRRGGGG